LEPLVEGVRQEGYDDLQRTLCNLERVYAAASGKEDRARARECRRLVIEAKEHARFAGRRAKDEGKRAMKEEMVLWMLTWLDDPGVFPVWVELRRRKLDSGVPGSPGGG